MLKVQHILCDQRGKASYSAAHCRWHWKIFEIFSLIFIGKKGEKCLMERGWSLELTDLGLDARSTTLSYDLKSI